eukprot:g4101.t1
MADYHYRYETHEKEDTEWDALQRKLGNLPQKPKKKAPAAFVPKEEPEKNEEWLNEQGEDSLEDLEDDFDDDQFLEQYRKKRLEELRNQKKSNIEFGNLIEIKGSQFITQVTEMSESTWIIVLLYQPRSEKCEMLESCLGELAADFPTTKFVKILSEECIPGYPSHLLPTILVYRNRSCKKTLTGLDSYGAGRITAETVAETLNSIGPICKQD